jgi:hypothetical protein
MVKSSSCLNCHVQLAKTARWDLAAVLQIRYVYPGSRISDAAYTTKKRGGGDLLSYPFL